MPQRIDGRSAKEEINLLENEDKVDEINLIEDNDADDENKNNNKENNVTTVNNKGKQRDEAKYTRKDMNPGTYTYTNIFKD